ncbi:chemotaxis protein CheW [Rivibacter subsaxonicus]|uniref:Twitching motility protein PilI n=1 Tax=Rivibacter subsaxonicus TaxID=457575 RepID=A0A4Q7VGQ0_9BURK|nr:chemotaxis protein CheW [Rivibacter subsaxonicus]RZT95187.1 twitching motility protein PilI [Rivibacter subsaxonicus]
MANKEALRELQTRLARRLQGAREQADTAASWLAVECAGQGFLLPLAQAGEIFPWAPVVPVPHSRNWFLGVANLRGRLHGVIDLAGFFGLRGADPVRDPVRMVAFNPALGINAALLVERLAGLRSSEQLKPHADNEPRPAFVGGRYADAQGRVWHELQLATLAEDEMFLRIAH